LVKSLARLFGYSTLSSTLLLLSPRLRVPLRDCGDFNSSGDPLHAAMNNATSGDTICVKDGTYNTSLWIYKDRLTFRSENGTANCIVNATGAYAFATDKNYVNISGFTVENATATLWWSAGIIIQGSNCNVSYNIARGNFFGINIDGGDHNLVAHNNASYNSQDGIRPANAANNNELTGNTANYNINGIYLYLGCNNSEIRNNIANYNSHKGIALDSNCNCNNLTNNTASYNNQHSIFLYDSSCYNNLTGNNASDNTENGFHLELNSQRNTLKSNIAEYNNFSIYLYDSCCYNNLTDNIARFSSWRGIVLHNSCNYNNLTNNTASNNVHDGIHFQNSCNYNNLTNNTANSNGVDGIDLEDSNNNTLVSNTASNNTKDGIFLYQSNNNTVSKNTVLENHQHGIQLENGSNNNVSCNWVQNSDDHGFHIGGSSTGNTFKYNNIVTNGIFIETNGSYQWQFYNGLAEGINANYNYWGPNMTSEKINDSIYGEVTYYPFNMSACPCAPIPEASSFFLVAIGLCILVVVRYFCGRKGKKARK
jgi:parallel beta-helix repeat protein